MNENELYVVKEYKFDNPLITDKNSIIGSCFKGCHNNFFVILNMNLSLILNLQTSLIKKKINLTISGKSMNLCDLKEIKVSRQTGFLFNQINKLTIKLCSRLRDRNMNFYLKFQSPMCHRHVFLVISQNQRYVKKFCNDVENQFHFACQEWFNQLN